MSDFNNAMNIVQAIVLGIGIVGHVISIIVFSRKTFRKNSISTYLCALSVFYCFNLPQVINFILLKGFNYNFPALNDAICKFWNYLPEIYSSVPAWILVAFSLDKYLSIRISSKTILNKKWFQLVIVFGIVLFDLCAYMWVPILSKRTESESQPGVFSCGLVSVRGLFSAFMILFALESCAVPFVAMIILSILTIRVLIESRRKVERVGRVDKERKSRDFRYAVSSITLNILFVVLKTPTMIYYLLNAYNLVSNVYFSQIAVLFFNINASDSFIVHLISNSLFRQEFLIMFRLRKRNRVSSNMGNTTHS